MIDLTMQGFAAVVTGRWNDVGPGVLTHTLSMLATVPDFSLTDIKGLRERIDNDSTVWMFEPVSGTPIYLGEYSSRDEAIRHAALRLIGSSPSAKPGTILSGRIYPVALDSHLYPDGVVEHEVEEEEPAAGV